MIRTVSTSLACAVSIVAIASPAAAQQLSFDVPAGSLKLALDAYVRQSGRPLIYDADQVRDARTGGVAGRMSADEALDALLRGTAFRVQRDGGAVAIVRTGKAVAEAAGEAGEDRFSAISAAEIVVTAQKREERLKDVPASITAVTGARLQDIVATKLDDYVGRIPGLVVAQVGGANAATQLVIRGLTTGPGGNPTVGVYIDDSPFGASVGAGGYFVPDLDPQDLARVEVLRGPQGTLYGAGSLGGLLKYVTADPDPTRFFGRVQVDGSTVDGGGTGYGVRGAANVPLAEDVALRVSAYDRRDPGYVDNVLIGDRNINDTHYYGGRASLGLKLGDAWKARLSGLYQHYSGSAPVVDYDTLTFRPAFGDLKQSRARGTTNVEQNIGAYSFLLEGDLGFATLTSASSYNRQVANLHLDYSSILSPVFAPLFGIPTLGFNNATRLTVNKYTQEVRLASPAADRLSWLIGVFYTRERQRSNGGILPIDSLTGATIAGLPDFGTAVGDQKFREIAAFGDATYRFSDAFDVTAGLRYSSNKQRYLTTTNGIIFPAATFDTPSKDHAVTFLVSPRFHIDKDVMIYARIASGYRPGGPNSVVAGGLQTYGPDKVTDYEIGLKGDLFDRKLSFELSGFWIDWTNIQIQRVSAFAAYIDNGPSAVSRGFEISTDWRPLRGLDLYANLAHIDAYLTEDLPVGSAIGLSGDRLPLTARWSGAAGGTYAFAVSGDWKASLGADWRYTGKRQGAFPNPGAPRFQYKDYDVLDLRAGLSDDRLSFTVFAKNIGDTRGQSSDVNLGAGLTSVSVIQPRTFGVSAAAKF